MTVPYPPYGIAKVRFLMTQAFTAVDLTRFLYDRPLFQPIVNRFGPGAGLDAIVEEVLSYCRTHILFDELLAAVKDDNPRAYEEFGVKRGLSSHPGREAEPGQGLTRWLDKAHLSANPFKNWTAEDEPELPKYFVDVGDFNTHDAREGPCVLFARRGCGKTAQRRMLAAQCRPTNRGARRLAVSYDYAGLERALRHAGGDVDRLEAVHHVSAILHETLNVLDAEYRRDPNVRSALSSQDVAAHLANYAARFAPDLPWAANGRAAALDDWGAVELMRGMADLLGAARLGQCVVLVDGLDDFPLAALDPGYAARFLAALLGTLPVIECHGWAFRFYLPLDVEPALRAHRWFRPDRMPAPVYLDWDRQKLEALITERLGHYSLHEPKYHDLEQLCEEDELAPIVMDELIGLSGGLPRAALVLADALIQAHCRQDDPPRRIGPAAWRQVKDEWPRRRGDLGLDAPGTARPVLRVNQQTGQVWVGTRDIRAQITSQDYQVLVCLYRHAGEVCSRDQIAREAWPTERDADGVSDQAMAAAIARLRRTLAECAPGVGYIQTVRGRERRQGGYRLYPEGFDESGSESGG